MGCDGCSSDLNHMTVRRDAGLFRRASLLEPQHLQAVVQDQPSIREPWWALLNFQLQLSRAKHVIQMPEAQKVPHAVQQPVTLEDNELSQAGSVEVHQQAEIGEEL